MSVPDGDPLFDLVVFLVASARDTVDTTAAYGGFRLLDGASRAIAARERTAGVPPDPFLAELGAAIERRKHALMESEEEFVATLDDLLAAVAREAKRRNLAEVPS